MTTMKRSREDNGQMEAEVMANCALMLLSRFNNSKDFECKTCNKRFSSFQALGGHRASHRKRPKLLGDFLIEAKKNKMHRCSICGAEFSLGQALGGHMRRHRDEINTEKTKMIPILNKRICSLDLNITPNDDSDNVDDDFKLWPMEAAPSPVLRIFI